MGSIYGIPGPVGSFVMLCLSFEHLFSLNAITEFTDDSYVHIFFYYRPL